MIVYELESRPNDYAALLVDDEHGQDVLIDAFDGTPMSDWWRPLRFHWETEGGRYPIPDYAEVSQGPVLSRRALDTLGDLLDGRGELLPIEIDDGSDYTIFNVTAFCDALDEDASDLERFRDGGVMIIDRYVLRPESLDGATIFKLPQQRARTYVTDAIVQRAEAANLTGMRFTEVWRDE